MIHAMGISNRATGFIAAVPYIGGMVAMIFWGRSSDLRGDRIGHMVLSYLLVAVSFAAACLTQNPWLVLLALTTGVAGVYSGFGPYYSLPSSFLRGTAAAGGIALVNSIASLSGFISPYLIGIIKQSTGDYTASMATLAMMEALAAVAILALGRILVPKPIAAVSH